MFSTPCWLCWWLPIVANIHVFPKNIILKFLSILKRKHCINFHCRLLSKRKTDDWTEQSRIAILSDFLLRVFLKQQKRRNNKKLHLLSSPSSSRYLFLFVCPCRQSFDTKKITRSHANNSRMKPQQGERMEGRKKKEREKEGAPQDEEAEREDEGMTNREKRRQTQDG